jgi:hypothetical protein
MNDSVAAQHVEEVGHLLRRDVAVELRAGEDARDLRDELWADDQLEALARPRAQNVARWRVAWSDERGDEDARVDDRAGHAAASRSRRIARSSSIARRVACSSLTSARCCVLSSSRSRR